MYLGERQDCLGLAGCPDALLQLAPRTVTLPAQPATTTSPPILFLPATSSSSTVSFLGYYTLPATTATPEPTAGGTVNAASSSSSKTPIIVGATIGSVVFLALVAFLAWFFLRRWRGRKMHPASRGTTPMLDSHSDEKSGMQGETPESEALRGSVGIFGPFGGYQQAPSTDDAQHDGPHREARDSMEIEEGGTLDAPVPNEEKKALVPPPDDEHPAYHPLPGKHLPAYVPGQPAYKSLPSQRVSAPLIPRVPEESPKIPGLVFSPIDITLGGDLDPVPLTPKAELAASPVPLRAITSPVPSSKFSTARTSPPPSLSQNSPPMDPAPLATVATAHSPPQREGGRLTNFSMKHISAQRPGYPSPTAGGKAELPASLPPVDLPIMTNMAVKAPLNPTPAFHHIYLPEPQSGVSTSSLDTAYSIIPIGLGAENADQTPKTSTQRDQKKQAKPSNLRQERRQSPQTKQEKRSPPLAEQEKKRSPHPEKEKRTPPRQTREPRASPPPTQDNSSTPPLPVQRSGLSLSDTHPALRDQVRRERGLTTPTKQEKRTPPPSEQRRSPPRQEKQSRPLHEKRSDVSAMSDSYFPLREQPSDVSIMTIAEQREGNDTPSKPSRSQGWSATERSDMTSWQVYKGVAPIRHDEVSPLFSPARRNPPLGDEGDMSLQPLTAQGPEGWSAVPLTPMTPLGKSRTPKRADGMF